MCLKTPQKSQIKPKSLRNAKNTPINLMLYYSRCKKISRPQKIENPSHSCNMRASNSFIFCSYLIDRELSRCIHSSLFGDCDAWCSYSDREGMKKYQERKIVRLIPVEFWGFPKKPETILGVYRL